MINFQNNVCGFFLCWSWILIALAHTLIAIAHTSIALTQLNITEDAPTEEEIAKHLEGGGGLYWLDLQNEFNVSPMMPIIKRNGYTIFSVIFYF